MQHMHMHMHMHLGERKRDDAAAKHVTHQTVDILEPRVVGRGGGAKSHYSRQQVKIHVRHAEAIRQPEKVYARVE